MPGRAPHRPKDRKERENVEYFERAIRFHRRETLDKIRYPINCPPIVLIGSGQVITTTQEISPPTVMGGTIEAFWIYIGLISGTTNPTIRIYEEKSQTPITEAVTIQTEGDTHRLASTRPEAVEGEVFGLHCTTAADGGIQTIRWSFGLKPRYDT
mgnify:CR=1 FL=1